MFLHILTLYLFYRDVIICLKWQTLLRNSNVYSTNNQTIRLACSVCSREGRVIIGISRLWRHVGGGESADSTGEQVAS